MKFVKLIVNRDNTFESQESDLILRKILSTYSSSVEKANSQRRAGLSSQDCVLLPEALSIFYRRATSILCPHHR